MLGFGIVGLVLVVWALLAWLVLRWLHRAARAAARLPHPPGYDLRHGRHPRDLAG